MTKNENTDLSTVIISFLESLPATVSTDILLFVMMYALDEDSFEWETFLPTIKEALTTTGGMKRMSVVIRVVGALDYVLWRSVKNLLSLEPTIKASAGKMRPELEFRILAGAPLRKRHSEKVLEDWNSLRADVITLETLHDYERNLLAQSRSAK